MTEPENEIQRLTPEQQRIAEDLGRAAAAYCNSNATLTRELAGSGFSTALVCGEASLTVEVVLSGELVSPVRSIRIFADWPAKEIDRREIVAFVSPPVHRA